MVDNVTERDTCPWSWTNRRTQRREGERETLYEPVTRVTSVTDAAVRCHWWCPSRHGRGMMRDEARLVSILVAPQAETEKP
jgi:hypothetical protein